MAVGARRRTGSSYALSVTGVAGPDGGSESKPVGSVYIAVADDAGVHTEHRRFLGDRQRIRLFTVHMALDLLRRRITGRCG
jgi:nicotinamide-nucleotide amidase